MGGIGYRGRIDQKVRQKILDTPPFSELTPIPVPLWNYLRDINNGPTLTYERSEVENGYISIEVSKPLDPKALKSARSCGIYIEAPIITTLISYLPWWYGDPKAVKSQ